MMVEWKQTINKQQNVTIYSATTTSGLCLVIVRGLLTERHVGVTLIFQVSLSTLLYIDSRLSNTQLSHQQHFKQHNYGRTPVRKLILILRPLWEKIRNAKLIITAVIHWTDSSVE
ncbi:conserved hypothetical protein [Trichinella spiralis]|uniref:hypothetical protein n=1 Tax=Trichinella spiralis TaxID=6334 RepID=UPI0001EFD5B0|nr:conserved hypothetical protein [Trichinella spiralis]